MAVYSHATSEFLINTETDGLQLAPSITALSDGGFVVTWASFDGMQDADGYGIKAQIYDSDGTPSGSEFLINTETNDSQLAPSITALSDGGFVITWESSDGADDMDNFGIKAQIYDADGSASGSEFLVNTVTDSAQLVPSITALSGGGFIVTWTSLDGAEDMSSFGIKAQIYDADGTPSGSEFLVNTQTNSFQLTPNTTGLSDGGFIITWASHDGVDDMDGYGIKAQIYDADGTPSGSEFLVNTETTNDQEEPSITALTGGGFVITWQSDGGAEDTDGFGIKAQIYNADGSASGSEFLVNTVTTNDQAEPSITTLADGGFVITWKSDDGEDDTDDYGIKARIFSLSNSDPTGSVTISGTTTEGNTLTAENTLADADGIGTLSYQWLRDNVAITGATEVSYDLTQDDVGAEISVTLSYTDGIGVEESVTSDQSAIIIADDNSAPLAESDTVTVSEDDTLSGTLTEFASDVDGDDLTFTIEEQPENGHVEISSTGTYTYTPDSSFTGSDSFTYRVSDGVLSAVGILTVTVIATVAEPENSAPTDIRLSTTELEENSSAGTVVATVFVTDPDAGDTYTLSLSGEDAGDFIVSGSELRVSDTAVLDFETDASRSITVRATDQDGAYLDETFEINLLDLGGVISGTAGDDTLTPTLERDIILLSDGGADVVRGTWAQLIGDEIRDLDSLDELVFEAETFSHTDLFFDTVSGILSVDTDGDGTADGELTLTGDFSEGTFMAVTIDEATHVSYETFLPELEEGLAVDTTSRNGINNTTYLTGTGSLDFEITLEDMQNSALDNTLGVYEWTEDGEIVNVQILIENTNAEDVATITLNDISDGNELGFFLIQDGADWAAGLSASDQLVFSIPDDETIPDLLVNDVSQDEIIFHSRASAMNTDGLVHTLSGVADDGGSIHVGFEDRLNGGDSDYQDIVFQISAGDFV